MRQKIAEQQVLIYVHKMEQGVISPRLEKSLLSPQCSVSFSCAIVYMQTLLTPSGRVGVR